MMIDSNSIYAINHAILICKIKIEKYTLLVREIIRNQDEFKYL